MEEAGLNRIKSSEALLLDLATGELFVDSRSVRSLSIDAVRQFALNHQLQAGEVDAEGFKKFSLPVEFAGEECRLRLDFEIATGRLDDLHLYWMGGTARAKQWDATPCDLKHDLRTLAARLGARLTLAVAPESEWIEEAKFPWGSVRLEASPKAMTITVMFNLRRGDEQVQ